MHEVGGNAGVLNSGVEKAWGVNKYTHTVRPSWRRKRTSTLVLGELAEMIGFMGVLWRKSGERAN